MIFPWRFIMKKKIIALCLSALFVAFTLTACGANSTVTTTDEFDQKLSEMKDLVSEMQERYSYKYEKGTVVDQEYRNKWLNLKIQMPDTYRPATEEIIQSLEENGVDCGMVFLSEESYSVSLSFIDLSDFDLTEDAYLQETVQQMSDWEKGSVIGNLGSEVIADKTFRVAYFDNINGAKQSLYAYKYDGKMCYIVITGASIEENEKLAARFTTLY